MRKEDTGVVIGSAVGAIGSAAAAILGLLCCAGYLAQGWLLDHKPDVLTLLRQVPA